MEIGLNRRYRVVEADSNNQKAPALSDSRNSLCSSVVALPAVLASPGERNSPEPAAEPRTPGFADSAAPFSPARPGLVTRLRVELKEAAVSLYALLNWL